MRCTSDFAERVMLIRLGDVSSDRRGDEEPRDTWVRGRGWRRSLKGCRESRGARFVRVGSVGDLVGENSGGGKIGSTLDVKENGEPGRVDEKGGGVADSARGLAWFETVGEAPGEEI